ncbi:hypothetical protein BDR07DRAFT_102649 [Suillus spraguei]|nr:hypothetical protein BDR07DRAFT_102649 [Suillus spraguei]
MSQQLQSLDGAVSSMQPGEAKQDKQRNSGRARPPKQHRIDITLPPRQHHPQMYGYYARSNAEVNPSYSFRRIFRMQTMSIGHAILPPQQMVPTECIEDGAVLVLYIFKDWPESYQRRPTQKQVDELTRFMGREPQWWVDIAPTRFRM